MMDWYVKTFLKSSLVWFGLGVTLGILMLARPAMVVYRPAHMHMNLLGFVTMMIFGVAYHVIPRFTGHPLHSPRLARAHVWMANAGLALLVLGWLLAPHVGRAALPVQLAGGTLAVASAYAFIYNVWRTIDGGRALAARAPRPGAASLPVAEPRSR
jgi:cytochrome c oxidase cbb3-type subunit 1